MILITLFSMRWCFLLPPFRCMIHDYWCRYFHAFIIYAFADAVDAAIIFMPFSFAMILRSPLRYIIDYAMPYHCFSMPCLMALLMPLMTFSSYFIWCCWCHFSTTLIFSLDVSFFSLLHAIILLCHYELSLFIAAFYFHLFSLMLSLSDYFLIGLHLFFDTLWFLASLFYASRHCRHFFDCRFDCHAPFSYLRHAAIRLIYAYALFSFQWSMSIDDDTMLLLPLIYDAWRFWYFDAMHAFTLASTPRLITPPLRLRRADAAAILIGYSAAINDIEQTFSPLCRCRRRFRAMMMMRYAQMRYFAAAIIFITLYYIVTYFHWLHDIDDAFADIITMTFHAAFYCHFLLISFIFSLDIYIADYYYLLSFFLRWCFSPDTLSFRLFSSCHYAWLIFFAFIWLFRCCRLFSMPLRYFRHCFLFDFFLRYFFAARLSRSPYIFFFAALMPDIWATYIFVFRFCHPFIWCHFSDFIFAFIFAAADIDAD